MHAFPDIISWDNWGEIMLDARLFTPLVREALSCAGLPCGRVEAGFPGTNAVFVSGEKYVVKLYAPMVAEDAAAERRCYRLMNEARLPLTPRLYGEGMLEYGGHKWEYVIVEYLPGRAVREIWPSMTPAQRENAGRFVGEWAAKYHALPDPFDPGEDVSASGWAKSLPSRQMKTFARLREAGCQPSLIDELAALSSEEMFRKRAVVLTHCDLTEDHLLVAGETMRLIDFADSRMAYPSLEWVPLWFGMLSRDEDAFFAYCGAAKDRYSLHELLYATVLHTYGAPILLSCVPGIAQMTRLDELAAFCPRGRDA